MGHIKGLAGILALAPGESGLPATVVLADEGLVIETSDGEPELWDRSLISADSYDTRTTELALGDTTFYFEANEPLAFAEQIASYLATPRNRRERREAKRAARSVSSRIHTELENKHSERSNTPIDSARPVEGAQPEPGTAQMEPRRRSGKAKKAVEHEHTWITHEVGGSITRGICSGCEQITIDLTGRPALTADPSGLRTHRRR